MLGGWLRAGAGGEAGRVQWGDAGRPTKAARRCPPQITRCPMTPCYISSPDECLWMDWVTEKNINGHQAKFFACIKRSDGSCAWYRGAAPPKQEFLDIEDP